MELKARCPECTKTVELVPAEVVLHFSVGKPARYVYKCPSCGRGVTRPADSATVKILVTAGARVVSKAVPAEALEPHEGAPLDLDDLIDFARDIAKPGVLETELESLAARLKAS